VTTPTASNIAQGDARVGVQAQDIIGDVIQAQAIHFDVHYELPPDASPVDKFRIGVRYLDGRMRERAHALIEEAAAQGYRTNEVHFHRLLALLSGRTLRQLASADFDRLTAICADISALDRPDEWGGGLRVVLRLLGSLDTVETERILKEVDALPLDQRDKIYDHLGVLLEGPMVDQMWHRSVEQARAARAEGGREERIWKFFHPTPARPRVRPVASASIPLREWIRMVIGAPVFVLAAGNIGALLLRRGSLPGIVGYVACLVGLAAFAVGGADRHSRRMRLRAKDAELTVPVRQRAEAPEGGFARAVDRLFTKYFRRYVPAGTERSYWLAQTAGIRRHLRDELVQIYREQRIEAEQIAWLIRYLVGDVRRRWEYNTLTAYRHRLRTPVVTTLLILGGLAGIAVGSYWAVPAAVLHSPLPGAAWILLAATSAVLTVRSGFRLVAERRRVVAEKSERAEQWAARWQAFERWQRKLADKPTDTEMATWLECDRKLLVDRAMRQARLRPSQVIAHAFIEAPAAPYKRARYPRGPWRYSRYHLLLFLLTDDGVRQVNIDLDFQAGTFRTTQRLNYRFDAVAAVRIDGIAAQRQTFELTLFNGDPISVEVIESSTEGIRPDEDPSGLADLSLDAAGLVQTLHVLEGIAAEGKEWVRHRRRRADNRLAELSGVLHDLAD